MPVVTQRNADVVEITLDWPEVRNALGPTAGRELRLALETAISDTTVATIVLSARGKAFCAGGNLPAILSSAAEGPEAVRATIYGEFQGIFRAIRQSPVPLLTAVDGPAIGLGCDLAMAGNVTFIGANGWLSQGWIKAGLIPATGGILYAARRGGEQAVWRLLAADRVDGPTAQSWGLAVACDSARSCALDMASKFASLPRRPLQAVTQLSRIDDPAEHLRVALDYQIGFITDPDFPRFAKNLLRR
jgi:enoyl-CoA hydratase/carnithine racemase